MIFQIQFSVMQRVEQRKIFENTIKLVEKL